MSAKKQTFEQEIARLAGLADWKTARPKALSLIHS